MMNRVLRPLVIVYTLFLLILASEAFAANQVVNVYAWASEIPDAIVKQFEKETGIHVNISTYDNNEIMYAKMRASQNAGYDVIMPSSYFVNRMVKQDMLLPLDKTKLPNFKNIDDSFNNPAYDPGLRYSVPYLWGVTGIFTNSNDFPPKSISRWSDLWNKKFYNQLMLLDDTRENFSIALLALGYSPNDTDPEHIKAAFEKLLALMPNVKVFSSDTVVSILIDEDATIGSAWNGDVYKASTENKALNFTFPQEGFVIWVDNFAIPRNAPHITNAYTFLNFILRPDIAKIAALTTNFGIVNRPGKALLPIDIQNNQTIYPSKEVMQRGIFQTDLGEKTLAIYEAYWEKLKMGA